MRLEQKVNCQINAEKNEEGLIQIDVTKFQNKKYISKIEGNLHEKQTEKG